MKQFFQPKTFLIALVMLALAAAISAAIVFMSFRHGIGTVQAGSSQNLSGWAWGGDFGWISFNCNNKQLCSITNKFCAVTSDCPGGETCTRDSCGSVDYGVNIDSYTGNFSGYAWSPNAGWISFQENTAPPDNYAFNTNCVNVCNASNNCTACYNNLNQEVYGWAKILTLGGNGWIKLTDDSVAVWNGKGVKINLPSGNFSGFAWNGNNGVNGGDTFAGSGWISFNCSDAKSCSGGDNNAKFCAVNTDCPNGGTCVDTCALANYKIVTGMSFAPNPPSNLRTSLLSCNAIRLDWNDNSNNETGFKAQSSPDGNTGWTDFCNPAANINYCSGSAQPSSTNYFRVEALGAWGNSTWYPATGGISATTGYCAPVLGGTPAFSCHEVDLSWTQSGSGVDHYEVYRSDYNAANCNDTDKSGCTWSQLPKSSPANIASTVFNFSDYDIKSNGQYYYKVKAQTLNLDSNIIGAVKACPQLPTWKEVKPPSNTGGF